MLASRRAFLTGSSVGLAFSALPHLARAQMPTLSPSELEADRYINEAPGYGPLKTDPFGLFDLPEGFSYTVVSQAGQKMDDGLMVPYKADGMGCFAGDGDQVILVRNHELKIADLDYGAFGVSQTLLSGFDSALLYDRTLDGAALTGGTTTLVYDTRARRLVSQHLSLAGTSTNCAGGRTPWGSWLSCEEIVQSAGDKAGKSHGWVFEVPSAAKGPVAPVPLVDLGRFRHEAAAVDPRTGVIYLTEDEGDGYGLFYRFLPNDRASPVKGGRLQALGFKDDPTYGDSRNWDQEDWKTGASREVVWIDLDGVDNPHEDLRARGHAKGAAWFARGEGIFHGDGEFYFTCTSGGPGRLGQIMRYKPSPHEGQAGEADAPGRLQLFVQPLDKMVLNMGDNIAVAPWGHLMVCEDKVGGVNYLKGVTPAGRVYAVGRNAKPAGGDVGTNSELAGVCFSPDGATLFVNIYWPGVTLAVTGPWGRFAA